MHTKHLLTASLVGGLISVALVNAPFVNLVNLLFCVGFWVGPLLAVGLYQRLNGSLTLGQALAAGTLAGAWHALLGLLLSLAGAAGAAGMLSALRSVLPVEDWPDVEPGLTGSGAFLFNLLGTVVDLAFGFLGGLFGAAIFNRRHTTTRSV